MSDEKNPVGAPSKYKEEYEDLAYKMCLLGSTDKELAAFLGVVESTINKWKLDYPKFSESITRGKELADMKVAGELFNGTMDKEVYEQVAIKCKRTTYDEDTGKKLNEEEYVQVVDVRRVIPADFRNQQFWLKNRKSNAWRDKTESSITISEQPLFDDNEAS